MAQMQQEREDLETEFGLMLKARANNVSSAQNEVKLASAEQKMHRYKVQSAMRECIRRYMEKEMYKH
jgi:hypothetical protein